MDASKSRQVVSRRFFVGCSAASALPLFALGKPEPQSFVPRNGLEHKLSTWLKGFTSSIHVSGARRDAPVYRVELHRNQWGEFYQSLAENFPSPRIGKNNLIELRSESHKVKLRVA